MSMNGEVLEGVAERSEFENSNAIPELPPNRAGNRTDGLTLPRAVAKPIEGVGGDHRDAGARIEGQVHIDVSARPVDARFDQDQILRWVEPNSRAQRWYLSRSR